MQPGLPEHDVRAAMIPEDLAVPEELVFSWGWHNGTTVAQPSDLGVMQVPENTFFDVFHLMSLQDSVRSRRWMRKLYDEELGWPEGYPLGWIPLLSSGAITTDLCADAEADSRLAPVYLYDHGGAMTYPPRPTFDSLAEALESAVDVACELERRDEAPGVAIAEIEMLEAETEQLRTRAAAIEALRTRLLDDRRTLALRAAEARDGLEHRRAEERDAQAELARAEEKGNREQLAEARRAVVRAQDAASSAAKRLARPEQLVHDLEKDAADAEREALTLEERAARAAAELETLPRLVPPSPPGPALAATIDWAARARAALFVTRNAAVREREAIAREANELGAATLGEPLFTASVAQLRRRLEESP